VTARFALESLPGRVVFGAGRVDEVPAELERLGMRRAVVVAGRREDGPAAPLEEALGGRLAGRVDRVRPHVPADVAEAGRVRVAELDGDGLVAIGGGSAIGLAKAVALTSGLPILAVPTTYAGSEMTPIWGITAGARKTTGRDLRVLPRTVVYDPALTTSLPPALSAASGMNALAHAAEALWVPAANPVVDALAEAAARALAAALPRVVAAPGDLEARSLALQGAHLAGRALAAVGTGLHHRLAHVLGGTFDLPHADVHAVLLPHTAAWHAAGHPGAVARLARGLGARDAPAALWDLGRAVGAPAGLAALGLTARQAGEAAAIAAGDGGSDPGTLRDLLERARRGERPGPGDP
jgi:maleylacetate reductase